MSNDSPTASSSRSASPGSMLSVHGGGYPLFRAWGIQVFLHWSWVLVAIWEIQNGRDRYSSIGWNVLEYLALFGIVLLHEFGHALACRSVGGIADRIVLWPLGGVAYVRPPQRPGPMLWSIVAGPLVNVALLLPMWYAASVLGVASPGARPTGMPGGPSDLAVFISSVSFINTALLIFNLLPIYPLDGGKILWAMLWFIIGRARSLMVACVLGLIGTIGVFGYFFLQSGSREGRVWLTIFAAFALVQSWAGLRYAWALSKVLALPRHDGLRCSSCGEAPPTLMGRCQCGNLVDPFGGFAQRGESAVSTTPGGCPACGQRIDSVGCPYCGEVRPIDEWSNQRSGAVSALPR